MTAYEPNVDARANRSVIVFRRDFLPLSETFIADHVRSLSRWNPVVACDGYVAGGLDVGALDPTRIYTDSDGRGARWRFQFLGRNPALEALVAERGVELIHAHFLTDGARIARFARRHRIPLIVTAHGYDATIRPSQQMKKGDGLFLQLMRKRLIHAADAIVCVSEFIRRELEARGYPPQKLVTIPLGLNLDGLAPGPGVAEREGALFVGRLVEKKGLRYLLEAWARLPPALRSTPLRIVGDGPLRGEMEALARALAIEPVFLGAGRRSEVLELMRRSRVFVFPSTRATDGDAEGMGLVAVEAQAVGTPVVAFDGGTGPEVLEDGRSGLLAPDRDIDALAARISQVLSDDDLAARLAAGGPAVVRERFDLEHNVAALERLYDRVAGQAHAAAGQVTTPVDQAGGE